MTSAQSDVVYICDWLPPDFGAVGQYALPFCRQQALHGKFVALYGLSSTSSSTEVENHGTGSLRIVRLKAAVYDRTNFRARAWWTLKTNLSLIRAAFADL